MGRGFLAASLSVSIYSFRTDGAVPLAPASHTLTALQRSDRGAEREGDDAVKTEAEDEDEEDRGEGKKTKQKPAMKTR